MSNKTVLMPRELTAENGAKRLLSGEFFEEIEVSCDCFAMSDDGNAVDNCCHCAGEGSYTQKAPIEWTTIKEIYAMAVKHFGDSQVQDLSK